MVTVSRYTAYNPYLKITLDASDLRPIAQDIHAALTPRMLLDYNRVGEVNPDSVELALWREDWLLDYFKGVIQDAIEHAAERLIVYGDYLSGSPGDRAVKLIAQYDNLQEASEQAAGIWCGNCYRDVDPVYNQGELICPKCGECSQFGRSLLDVGEAGYFDDDELIEELYPEKCAAARRDECFVHMDSLR